MKQNPRRELPNKFGWRVKTRSHNNEAENATNVAKLATGRAIAKQKDRNQTIVPDFWQQR